MWAKTNGQFDVMFSSGSAPEPMDCRLIQNAFQHSLRLTASSQLHYQSYQDRYQSLLGPIFEGIGTQSSFQQVKVSSLRPFHVF